MKFRIARKLNYLKKARHRHGHGIHSPFLFHLITKVIENKKHLSAYKVLRDQRDRLSNLIKDNSGELEIQTFRDPILIASGRKNLFKAVELPFRYGKLLLRLVNEFKPKTISCYGPSFGLNLLYLTLSDESIPVNFVQSDNSLIPFCQATLENAAVKNVNYYEKETLPEDFSDFVFINFPFSPEETEKSIKTILDTQCEREALIIRGIHESKGLESIWSNLIKDNVVRISLDLFEIGIVLFQKNLQKEHFVLRFKNK